MTHHENLKILAFVGLTGSGKSTAVEYFTDKGFPRVYFGGVVINAVKEAGLEVNEANEKTIREKLRTDEGKDFVVQHIISQIEDVVEAGQHRIIADGLYTWTEYKVLKEHYHDQVSVIAIISPKQQRYHRLSDRPVRPLTEQEASGRDYAEIENLEKGGPIAMADYFVMNDENVEGFYKQLDAIAEEIDFLT